jgi:hypothetical protein
MKTYIRSSSYTHRQHSSPCTASNPIARKLTRTRILGKHLLDLRHIALLLQLQDTRYGKGSRSRNYRSRLQSTKSSESNSLHGNDYNTRKQ